MNYSETPFDDKNPMKLGDVVRLTGPGRMAWEDMVVARIEQLDKKEEKYTEMLHLYRPHCSLSEGNSGQFRLQIEVVTIYREEQWKFYLVRRMVAE